MPPAFGQIPDAEIQESSGTIKKLKIVRKRGVCDRDQVIEEPDEVKVSRPVLKPSGMGDPTAQVNIFAVVLKS